MISKSSVAGRIESAVVTLILRGAGRPALISAEEAGALPEPGVHCLGAIGHECGHQRCCALRDCPRLRSLTLGSDPVRAEQFVSDRVVKAQLGDAGEPHDEPRLCIRGRDRIAFPGRAAGPRDVCSRGMERALAATSASVNIGTSAGSPLTSIKRMRLIDVKGYGGRCCQVNVRVESSRLTRAATVFHANAVTSSDNAKIVALRTIITSNVGLGSYVTATETETRSHH